MLSEEEQCKIIEGCYAMKAKRDKALWEAEQLRIQAWQYFNNQKQERMK